MSYISIKLLTVQVYECKITLTTDNSQVILCGGTERQNQINVFLPTVSFRIKPSYSVVVPFADVFFVITTPQK